MKQKRGSQKKLKTFNLDQSLYEQFSQHCKTNGISMSKKIENFIQEEINKLKLSTKILPKEKEHSFSKYC